MGPFKALILLLSLVNALALSSFNCLNLMLISLNLKPKSSKQIVCGIGIRDLPTINLITKRID